MVDIGGCVAFVDFDFFLGLFEGDDEALVVGFVDVDVDVEDLVLALFLEGGDLEEVLAVLPFGEAQLSIADCGTLTGTLSFERISAAG